MSDQGGVTTAAGQAKRAQVLELVISGRSVTEAAVEVGVSRRHAYRLISDPEARAEIARSARESAKAAQLVLQRGAEEAARSLVAMASGKTKATPAKVAAARGVLDYTVERAATSLNVTAGRLAVPEAFAAGAAGVLERALEEADAQEADQRAGQGVASLETAALPGNPESRRDVANEGDQADPTVTLGGPP